MDATLPLGAVTLNGDKPNLWLKSKKWDLTFISLSVLLMALPYASYFLGQSLGLDANGARNVVNYIIAFCIGGPHMYATYTRTMFEPEFRKRHMSILPAAIIIPSIVIFLGVNYFILLLTFFFFWASVHVLHQIVFIVDCYRGKHRASQSTTSKFIDYGVVLTALYPMAMYRFVHGTFHVGSNYLYFPEVLKVDAVWWLASALFATAFVLYVSKTIMEFRRGIGNIPKTILISVTIIATFITPFFGELDVAFQGLNSWHSFQYLGLTWYINRLRLERGEITAPTMRKISGPGSWWKYYGLNVSLNSIILVLIGGLYLTQSYHHLTLDQCYYIVILSILLQHYYHDHILFRFPQEIRGAEIAAGAIAA
jgi:hypothetical protein